MVKSCFLTYRPVRQAAVLALTLTLHRHHKPPWARPAMANFGENYGQMA